MTKSDIKSLLTVIGYNLLVLLYGLGRVILGMIAIGLLSGSIYGFCTIPNEGGYIAVLTFIVSCISFIISLAQMYLLGLPNKIKSKQKGGK